MSFSAAKLELNYQTLFNNVSGRAGGPVREKNLRAASERARLTSPSLIVTKFFSEGHFAIPGHVLGDPDGDDQR